jgi:hypothetical protein
MSDRIDLAQMYGENRGRLNAKILENLEGFDSRLIDFVMAERKTQSRKSEKIAIFDSGRNLIVPIALPDFCKAIERTEVYQDLTKRMEEQGLYIAFQSLPADPWFSYLVDVQYRPVDWNRYERVLVLTVSRNPINHPILTRGDKNPDNETPYGGDPIVHSDDMVVDKAGDRILWLAGIEKETVTPLPSPSTTTSTISMAVRPLKPGFHWPVWLGGRNI